MTSVLREIWAECCDGGAYRDGVIIHISWREGKVWLIGGSEDFNLLRGG